MPDKLRLRINTAMPGHAAGSVVEVPTYEDGTPTQLFWRRRIRDAFRPEGGDGCVTILADEPEAEATAP